MTTTLDLGSLADAAADYRAAIARLESATHDAESAWRLLPEALDSPGTQIAVGRYVGPAHALSSGLLSAADALHTALSSDIQTLRYLQSQAEAQPDEPDWGTRAEATLSAVAATIASITGGEAGSVALPCPAPPARQGSFAIHRATTLAPPLGPALPSLPEFTELINGARALGSAIGSALDAAGAAAADVAGAAAAGVGATVAGVLGTGALVLSLGGSTDTRVLEHRQNKKRKAASAEDGTKAEPRPGPGDDYKITRYQPCDPKLHGPGCQKGHKLLPDLVDKPEPGQFTGEKVWGDEPPGEMPGTESDWVKSRARNDKGEVYTAPDGRSVRVMEPWHDLRYPNGYVVFEAPGKGTVDLDMFGSQVKNDVHIVRNPDGSFPIPEGWNK